MFWFGSVMVVESAQEGVQNGESLAGQNRVRTDLCKGLDTLSRMLTKGSGQWHRRVPDHLERSCIVGKAV